MNPGDLLAELRSRGLYVEPAGDDQLLVGPPELVDDETLERIRSAKRALLAALSADATQEVRTWPCVRCDRFRFSAPVVCYWCRRAEELEGHA